MADISLLHNPMTTQDDIIVGGASGAAGRLAKGTDGQVLTVDPTTHHLVWATPSSGFSDPMTTRGDIIVRNSSNTTARLARGSANTVLQSDGTDVAYGSVLPAHLDVSADNTTANATSGHHGLLPKLSGSSSDALKGDGSWGAVSGGGLTHAYAGYNTVGASTETPTTLRVYMKKITLANDCMLGALELYLDMSADAVAGTLQLGLWTDSAGVPLSLIHQSGYPGTDNFYLGSSSSSWPARWISIGSYSKWLTAGDYWIGWQFFDIANLRMYYDSGSDRYISPGVLWFANGDRYSQTDSTRKYSVRVSTIR